MPGGTPANPKIAGLLSVARDYAGEGVRMLLVNPNDAERYPRDSLEAMRSRVERGEFDGVPYLRDESQEVARAYGAQTTPDVFVLEGDHCWARPDADLDTHEEEIRQAAIDCPVSVILMEED